MKMITQNLPQRIENGGFFPPLRWLHFLHRVEIRRFHHTRDMAWIMNRNEDNDAI